MDVDFVMGEEANQFIVARLLSVWFRKKLMDPP